MPDDGKGNAAGPVTDAQVAAALPPFQQSFVRNYCAWAQARSDAPLGYHAVAAYHLVAVTAPSDLVLTGLAGGPVYGNLWGLLIGRSGIDRKSSAIGLARRMLSASAPNLVSAEPASSEALVKSFIEKPTQLWFSSEYSKLLASTQGQNNYLTKIKTEMTDLFDGAPIAKTFANHEVDIPYPRFSLLGAITPSYLARHTEESDWSGGFLSRKLFMFCRRERTLHVDQSNPDFETLLQNALHFNAHQFNSGGCLGWAPDALDLWIKWNDSFLERYAGHSERLSGQLERCFLMAKKLILLHAWDYGGAKEGAWWVTRQLIEPAIAMAELHWQSVCAIAPFAMGTYDIRQKEAVLNALSSQEWISAGGVVSRVPEVGLLRRVKEILGTLEAEGLVAKHTWPGTTIPVYTRLEDRPLEERPGLIVPRDGPIGQSSVLTLVHDAGAPQETEEFQGRSPSVLAMHRGSAE